MEIKELTAKSYKDFISSKATRSFLQEPAMAEVLKNIGADVKILALVDEKAVLAAGVAFERKIFLGKRLDMMAGVIAYDEANELLFYENLKRYAKNTGVSEIIIKLDKTRRIYSSTGESKVEPNEDFVNQLTERGYARDRVKIGASEGMPDWQYLKDLEDYWGDDGESLLLDSFNTNCRRKIKKAKELGVRIRKISYDEIELIKDINSETGERQGFDDKSIGYYRDFYNCFGSDTDFLIAELELNREIDSLNEEITDLRARGKKHAQRIESLERDREKLKEIFDKTGSDKVILSSAIMVRSGDEVTYFLGGSRTDYQWLGGSFLLQYKAMADSAKSGYKRYNFYGISGKFDGSDGVLRFKQNFDGYIIEKQGGLVYYPKPAKTKIINILKKITGRI